jgi:hypothetical protein
MAASPCGAAADFKGIGDPTLPPVGVAISAAGAASATASLPGHAPGQAQAPAPSEQRPKPVALDLQSIRFRPDTGHAVAVINGEVVEVGDKVAEMRVMSISRHGAELKGPAGLRKLTLRFDVIESESDPLPVVGKVGTAGRGLKESK